MKIIEVYLTQIYFKIKFYHYTSDSKLWNTEFCVSVDKFLQWWTSKIEIPVFMALCRWQHISNFSVRVQ